MLTDKPCFWSKTLFPKGMQTIRRSPLQGDEGFCESLGEFPGLPKRSALRRPNQWVGARIPNFGLLGLARRGSNRKVQVSNLTPSFRCGPDLLFCALSASDFGKLRRYSAICRCFSPARFKGATLRLLVGQNPQGRNRASDVKSAK
jgi:hypothetical protein